MINLLKKLKIIFFFKSDLYNFIINKKIDEKIQYNPESLWTGSKSNGLKIIEKIYQKKMIVILELVEQLHPQFF